MTSGISASLRQFPSASSPLHSSGAVPARGALRPLALGLGLAAFSAAVIILGAYIEVFSLSGLMPMALALPVLCTLLLVWGRSTSLEITSEGFRCRRLLAPSRSYPASAVLVWGFEGPSDVLSTIPPQAFAPGWARFVLETTDGRRFQSRVSIAEAHRIVTLLLQHETGLACDRRRAEL